MNTNTNADTVTIILTTDEYAELELIMVDHDVDPQEVHEPVERNGQIVLTLHVNDANELVFVMADQLAMLDGDESTAPTVAHARTAPNSRHLATSIATKISEVLSA